MNFKLTIAALLLAMTLSLPSTAKAESFELDLIDMRLPATAAGFVAYRACQGCAFTRSQTTADTVYELNGNSVTFQQFRRAANGAANKKRALVTILYDTDIERITLISVRIRS